MVLGILGLLSTFVGLSLRGHLRRSALNRAIESIKFADQQARQLARSGLVHSVQLRTTDNRLILSPRRTSTPATSLNSRPKTPHRREFRLPQGVRVAQIGQRTDVVRDSGIDYFRDGTSTSSALKLELSGTTAYVCILGMGGQTLAVPTEAAVKEILVGGR